MIPRFQKDQLLAILSTLYITVFYIQAFYIKMMNFRLIVSEPNIHILVIVSHILEGYFSIFQKEQMIKSCCIFYEFLIYPVRKNKTRLKCTF